VVAAPGKNLVFGRIGQREGFFQNDKYVVKIEEYLI